jgi:hypothetical protein
LHLLDEHEEALEADLRREYKVDLRDVYRGRMDWRELRVFVIGLPPHGTATARSIHGTEAGDWTSTHEMLRRLANVASEHAWAFFEVNRDHKKDSKPVPRPDPIESPFADTDAPEPSRPAVKGPRKPTSAAETDAKLRRLLG